MTATFTEQQAVSYFCYLLKFGIPSRGVDIRPSMQEYLWCFEKVYRRQFGIGRIFTLIFVQPEAMTECF